MRKHVIQFDLKLLIVIALFFFANVSFCQSNKTIRKKLRQNYFSVEPSALNELFSHSWYEVAKRSNRKFLGKKITIFNDSERVYKFDSTSIEFKFKGGGKTEEFVYHCDLDERVDFTSKRVVERVRYEITFLDNEYLVIDVFWYINRGLRNYYRQKKACTLFLKKM